MYFLKQSIKTAIVCFTLVITGCSKQKESMNFTHICEDHFHNWYDFWSAPLGSPVSPMIVKYNNINGLYIRKFENGWAVYNNSGAEQSITFPRSVLSISSNLTGSIHKVPDLDGEIYLRN